MAVFGKEEDYIDYTLLKKKGLLKIKEEQINKNLKTEEGFVDFTSPNNSNKFNGSNNLASSSANNFGFLSDMASLGASVQNNANRLSDNINKNINEKEFNELKIKVDDLNYKIDRFIERIDKLEEKLARSERSQLI